MKVGLGVGIKLVRSTKIYSGAVPGHGEQAHINPSGFFSEKPKETTYCSHLFKNGRNLDNSPPPRLFFLSAFIRRSSLHLSFLTSGLNDSSIFI